MERHIDVTLIGVPTKQEGNDFLEILDIVDHYFTELRKVAYSSSDTINARILNFNERNFGHRTTKKNTGVYWGIEYDKEGGFDVALRISRAEGRCKNCMIVSLEVKENWIGNTDKFLSDLIDPIAIKAKTQSGRVHDLTDFSQQNELGPQYFKSIGKPLSESKIKYSHIFNDYIVDLEQNPAHLHVVGAIDYTAAWTMYLGESYLQEIPVEEIHNLEAEEIVNLGKNLMRVTLFKNPFEFSKTENINRMWRFRERLRIDFIAHEKTIVY